MSYVGMATSMVGGIMQSIAASMENSAMQHAFNQEMRQQLGFSGQEFGQWVGDLPSQGSEAAGRAIDSGAQKAQGMYGQVNNMPLLAGGGGGSASPYASTDNAALQQAGSARARIGGLSDWQLGRAIDDLKTKDAINRINFRSQGQAQLFPYKMYNAQHSQDELDFWGKTISSIGNSGAGAALSTNSPPTTTTGPSGAPGAWSYGGIANPQLIDSGTGMYMPTSNIGNTNQLLPATGMYA